MINVFITQEKGAGVKIQSLAASGPFLVSCIMLHMISIVSYGGARCEEAPK